MEGMKILATTFMALAIMLAPASMVRAQTSVPTDTQGRAQLITHYAQLIQQLMAQIEELKKAQATRILENKNIDTRTGSKLMEEESKRTGSPDILLKGTAPLMVKPEV